MATRRALMLVVVVCAAFPLLAQIIVTQADLAVTQSAPPLVLHGATFNVTVNVINNGANAGGATLTDSFSGVTFVSATSSVGTCSGSGPVTCSFGVLAPTTGATVTLTFTADTLGGITNTASVTGTVTDPVPANNTSSAAIAVTPVADLKVEIADSADPVATNSTFTYLATLTNLGADTATGADMQLTLTNGTIVSVTSSDPALSCGIDGDVFCFATSLPPGSYGVTVSVQAPPSAGTMSLSGVVQSSSSDPVTGNNTASEATTVTDAADLVINKRGPSSLNPGESVTYSIEVTNNGPNAALDVVVRDSTPSQLTFVSTGGACSGGFPCSFSAIAAGETKTILATYTLNDTAVPGRRITNRASVTSATPDPDLTNNEDLTRGFVACTNTAPTSLTSGVTLGPNGTLTWEGSGDSFVVYLGLPGGGCTTRFATTTTNSLTLPSLNDGEYEYRVESLSGECLSRFSSCVTFSVNNCVPPSAPLVSVVGQTLSGIGYEVAWDPVPTAVRYELSEARNPDFSDAVTQPAGTRLVLQQTVNQPTAFYYRARAIGSCTTEPGPWSLPARVVVAPQPSQEVREISVAVPVGSTTPVVIPVFIDGEAGATRSFTATTDREWLSVTPASGSLPPDGTTLQLTALPGELPNGTFTATLIITIDDAASSRTRSNATTLKIKPVSVSLVTPVTPVPAKPAASQYALIIPSISHLDGQNSQWRSDVRVTNAGFRRTSYRLTYTPAGGSASGVRRTDITVDAGATTALDDILSNWYGAGPLGENAGGMLEILPLEDAANAFASTVASSRTYNATANGTLGQFVPAIPFLQFIGKSLPGSAQSVLSLQQVAETNAFRTNVGIAEASGNPAVAEIAVFNGAGTRLLQLTQNLAAGEQRQLNGLLAANGLSLSDARIEVKVADGAGKVTAYASVVDNGTGDPQLVNGVPLSTAASNRYVVPGVANINNPVAQWPSDLRLFNYGATAQQANLSLYEGTGAPKVASLTLPPGVVVALDDIVGSLFASPGSGGALQIATFLPSSLVVTGRTYNQGTTGTLGQFIPAITPAQATALGARALNVLQVEDSSRYRTNIGIAEVSGAPAVVELQVILPESKITPTVQVPIAANEFRQFALLKQLGLSNTYNARVIVRVVQGQGKVAAYGSIIDELTQDPTYVPAQ